MRSVVAGIMCSTITLAIGQSSRGGEPCNSRPSRRKFDVAAHRSEAGILTAAAYFIGGTRIASPFRADRMTTFANLFLGFVIPRHPITQLNTPYTSCADC